MADVNDEVADYHMDPLAVLLGEARQQDIIATHAVVPSLNADIYLVAHREAQRATTGPGAKPPPAGGFQSEPATD